MSHEISGLKPVSYKISTAYLVGNLSSSAFSGSGHCDGYAEYLQRHWTFLGPAGHGKVARAGDAAHTRRMTYQVRSQGEQLLRQKGCNSPQAFDVRLNQTKQENKVKPQNERGEAFISRLTHACGFGLRSLELWVHAHPMALFLTTQGRCCAR